MYPEYPTEPEVLISTKDYRKPKVQKWLHHHNVTWVSGTKVSPNYLPVRRRAFIKLNTRNDERYLTTTASTPPVPVLSFDKPLTTEEIFVIFLKEHRKFSEYKRILLRGDPHRLGRLNRRINTKALIKATLVTLDFAPYRKSRVEVWGTLSTKWVALCKQFNLSPTADLNIIISSK